MVSTPGTANYSNGPTLNDVKNTLLRRLTDKLGTTTADRKKADRVITQNLQLAAFRPNTSKTWPDGKTFGLHSKLIMVDDAAFYIGSRNVYPSWHQEHGFIIEDKTAVQQIKQQFLNQEWYFSCATALVDWNKGICATK